VNSLRRLPALCAFAAIVLGVVAVACWRGLRYQMARAFRRGRIPADGDPLRPEEMAVFVDTLRHYGDSAEQPAYPQRGSR